MTRCLRIPTIYIWGYLTSLTARERVASLLKELARMSLQPAAEDDGSARACARDETQRSGAGPE